jgi:hypothetical protein
MSISTLIKSSKTKTIIDCTTGWTITIANWKERTEDEDYHFVYSSVVGHSLWVWYQYSSLMEEYPYLIICLCSQILFTILLLLIIDDHSCESTPTWGLCRSEHHLKGLCTFLDYCPWFARGTPSILDFAFASNYLQGTEKGGKVKVCVPLDSPWVTTISFSDIILQL